MIYKSLTELIGHTPMMELVNYQKQYQLSSKILAKLESFNPAGSIKDRVAKEMIEQAEQLLRAQSVRILGLDACHFIRNAPMHVFGRFLIDMPERILHGILVHPHAGGKLVSFKIIQRSIVCLVVTVRLFFHDNIVLN